MCYFDSLKIEGICFVIYLSQEGFLKIQYTGEQKNGDQRDTEFQQYCIESS